MDNKSFTILLCLLVISTTFSLTLSIKVGVLPLVGGSHTLSMDIITQQLIKRGHEVVTIISNEPSYLKKLKPSPLALYEVNNPITSQELNGLLSSRNPFYPITGLYQIQTRYCDAILSNKTLLQSIQDVDIIFGDSLFFCSILVPEVLNKPYITVSFSGGIFGFHTFLADYEPTTYIPLMATMIHTKMNFLQRAFNVIFGKISLLIIDYYSAHVINQQRIKHNISTHLTLHQLRRKYSLHLCTLDFSIEYTRPLPPDIQVVGPVTPKPASPLPKAFEDIMQNSKGVVLVSFGSELQLATEKLSEMVQALGQLPYTVIWKTRQTIDKVPDNVKIKNWIPQNDLLGHPKIVAFITHCGANGMFEAAYHGVPMVGMPGMVEQRGNSAKLQRAGIAVYVDFKEFKAADVVNAVLELTTNARYKKNAIKVSKIIKSPSRIPTDIIVDWIEYAIKTDGAHHLKVEGENLWFYEYYNLDVILAVTIFFYIVIRIFRSCMSAICGSGSKTKED